MTEAKLKQIINKGESTTIEFKKATAKLNSDTFESICGFMNRSGGHLILGIKDNKSIIGVQEDKIQEIIDHLVSNANSQRVNTRDHLKPKIQGTIDPRNFPPYPKNPTIARIFKEIGWVDELGSGIRNTFKLIKYYTPGAKPEFIEGDVFKTIIPLDPADTKQKVREKTREKKPNTREIREEILKLIKENKKITIRKMAENIGITKKGIEYHISKLKESKEIKRIGPSQGGYWKVL